MTTLKEIEHDLQRIRDLSIIVSELPMLEERDDCTLDIREKSPRSSAYVTRKALMDEFKLNWRHLWTDAYIKAMEELDALKQKYGVEDEDDGVSVL